MTFHRTEPDRIYPPAGPYIPKLLPVRGHAPGAPGHLAGWTLAARRRPHRAGVRFLRDARRFPRDMAKAAAPLLFRYEEGARPGLPRALSP